MTRLPVLQFDTANIEPDGRLDAVADLWRNYLSFKFFEGAEKNFHLKSTVWWIDGCTFVHSIAAPMICGLRTPTDNEQLISISFLKHGRQKYLVQDQLKQQTSEAVHISRHGDQKLRCCPTDSEILILYVPSVRLGVLPDEPFRSRTFPVNRPVGSIMRSKLLALRDSLDGSSATESISLSERILSFLEVAIHNSVDLESMNTNEIRRAAINKYIDEHIKDHSLSPNRLCNEFGMSRPTLYRLFEEADGVMAYIAKRRTKCILDKLSRSKPKWGLVRTVAEEFGYNDMTVFNRTFRRHTGVTPGGLAGLRGDEFASALTPSPDLLAISDRAPVVFSNATSVRMH